MFKWSCPADPADSMPLLDISRHAGPGRPLSPLALKNFATKEMLDHHVHHYNKPNIQTHTSNSHASLGNASLHVWLYASLLCLLCLLCYVTIKHCKSWDQRGINHLNILINHVASAAGCRDAAGYQGSGLRTASRKWPVTWIFTVPARLPGCQPPVPGKSRIEV